MSAPAAPSRLERPRPLLWVGWALWALVLIGAVISVLVVVRREELMAAWTAGHPPDSAIEPLSFVPVALVCYATFAGTTLLMLAFLRGGHGWARWCLVATVAFVVIATLAALRTSPPTAFVVVSLVGLVVELFALALLWHPELRAFLRTAADRERRRPTSTRP